MNTSRKVVGVIFLCLIGGCLGLMILGDSEDKELLKRNTQPIVTLAEFNAVQPNMTRREVDRIVSVGGYDGFMSWDSDTADFLGHPIRIEFYEWENGDMSNMKATFLNDRLMTKSQVNLK